MKDKTELESIEDYLIKNRGYAVDGITRAELQRELLLDESEMEKLVKKKISFSIGEAAKLLLKVKKENLKEEVK